jgi:hypothetical protein
LPALSVRATSAWQQGTSTMNFACFCRPKAMASSVAVSQACSAVTTSMRAGSSSDWVASATLRFRKAHALEAQARGQFARLLHQFGPGLDAVDVAGLQRLEVQVVNDEAQVGLARAVVGQREAALATLDACNSCRIFSMNWNRW